MLEKSFQKKGRVERKIDDCLMRGGHFILAQLSSNYLAKTTNNEFYEDPLFPKKKIQTMNKVMIPMEVSLEQLLEIIAKADILLKAPDPDVL